MSSSGNNPIPHPTRHITDTDSNGDSFFHATSTSVPMTMDLGQGACISLGYSTMGPAPISMTAQQDLNAYLTSLQDPPPPWPTNGGNTLFFVDTPPGASSEMHRTQTLDYMVQILGEIELTLSSGEKRLIRPGDVVVQRGTLHQWRNPSSTQWSRLVGVVAGALPIVTKNGQALDIVM